MTEYNAANRKDIRKREREIAQWRSERQNVVVDLMSTIYGRRWVWERLEAAHIFVVNPNSETMQFTEGERNQGLQLLADVMEACPDQFILAMREANARSTSASRPEPSADTDAGSDAESFADDAGADAS